MRGYPQSVWARRAIWLDNQAVHREIQEGIAQMMAAAAAAALARTATSAEKAQATTSGANALIPLVYGTQRVGGKVAAIKVDSAGRLVVLVVWCLGEIDAVVGTTVNNDAPPAGVAVANYTGTASQGVDATLAATFTGFGDAMPGVAYSVFSIPDGLLSGFPRFGATIRGMKVRTTSGGARSYQDNPAYLLADLIESTTYGLGAAVDWTSVAAAAAVCAEVLGSPGEPRRQCSVTFDSAVSGEDALQTLRDYAGCFVVQDGPAYRLIPDAPGSSVMSFDASNIVEKSVSLQKRGNARAPTMVEVAYTDTSVTPWRTARYTTPPVLPRRLSRVQKPGITRYSEAVRYATERLNDALLCDLAIQFTAFDEALQLQVGDLFDVTHPLGLSGKMFRALRIVPMGDGGRWQITGVEYDPARYSDTVAAAPTTADTALISPSTPPPLSSLVAAEETYATDTGAFASRVKITLTAPATFPFVRYYQLIVRDGSNVVASALIDRSRTEYATQALAEGTTYTVTGSIVSTVGAIGAEISTLVALQGKRIPPGNVPSVDGLEAGGRVFLNWRRADNPTNPGTPDPDVWRYEIRRSTTGGSWDTATVVDVLDALRIVDEAAPVGPWRYWVKAIDSVRQYSSSAAYKDITVTSDAASFLVDAYDQTSPTLTNMAEYNLGPTDGNRHFVTEDGTAFGTAFGSNLSTYTNALATYHGSVTSTWLGESEDFGTLLGGQWTGTATVSALSGSLTSYFGYSSDGSSWTYASGLSQKFNARFARLKHETTTTGTLLVTIPTQNIRLDAIPREEVGTGTSSASSATTVTLTNAYVAVKKLTITAEGNSARMGIYDNIVVGSPTTFDVYVFNDSGAKIASTFRYAFQGV